MINQPRYARVYPVACALALIALCPYLVLTTAEQPLRDVLTSGLHSSMLAVGMVDGIADGAFALGALAAADLAQRFESRRLFLVYQVGLAAGALLSGVAPSLALYAVGRILLGLSAGFMLIGALPQLIRRYGPDRLPTTGLVVNIGLFGATVAGPTVGGVVASGDHWRAAFSIIAAVGVANLVLGLVGFESVEAERPGITVDLRAFALAAVGVFAPFVGVALLEDVATSRTLVTVLVAVGLLALVGLVYAERRREASAHGQPLVPASLLATSVPVLGTVMAAAAGAVVALLIQLVQLALQVVGRQDPGHAGLLFLPLVPGLVVGCVVYRIVFTRTAVFGAVLSGGLALIGAGAILVGLDARHPTALVLVASALLGYGAATTVSPGLFLASLGVPSAQLARTFALVELLRTEATFVLLPVFTAIAGGVMATGHDVHIAIFATLDLAVLSLMACLLVLRDSGLRPQPPRIANWLDESGLGLDSPPLRWPSSFL